MQSESLFNSYWGNEVKSGYSSFEQSSVKSMVTWYVSPTLLSSFDNHLPKDIQASK